jgi:hypothetical protein
VRATGRVGVPEGRVTDRPSPARIDALLAALAPLPLESLGGPTLLDRLDTKYLVSEAQLPALLGAAVGRYHVLTVRGAARQHYRTTYYDSATLACYRAHLAGRSLRFKVRERCYVSSGDRTLEVKVRDAGGRTRKHRTPSDGAAPVMPLDGLPDALQQRLGAVPLLPVLRTAFDRIALVRPDGEERVTIDTALHLATADAAVDLPGVAIVEVKQARRGPSPFREALREARVQPRRVSKYCLGIALLRPDVPHHRFRPLLAALRRLTDAAAPTTLTGPPTPP